MLALSREQQLRQLWQGGRLRWKLLPQARRAYAQIHAQWGRDPFLINCHRNFTKSTLLLTLADEACRQRASTPVAIVCDTKAHALAIVEEKLSEYLVDCPEDLKPKTKLSQRGFRIEYANGSRIWLFGADDSRHIKTLRGLGFYLVLIDEGGHIDGSKGITLKVIMRSIALPAIAKLTKADPTRIGQLVIATTSPMDEVHDFWALWDEFPQSRFMQALEDNPDFDAAYKAKAARDSGGLQSVDYRREYGCERISLADAVPLPQITLARLNGSDGKPALVQVVPKPSGPKEWLAGQDVGGRHLTADLWGYYEPANDTVYILREWSEANVGTKAIADAVRSTEAELFGLKCSELEFARVQAEAESAGSEILRAAARKRVDALIDYPEFFDRWSDPNNTIVLHDLAVDHGVHFYETRKDDKYAYLSELRREITAGRVVIDERCERLILTLRTARWKQSATQSASAPATWTYSKAIGHADLLDALLYLVRNVRRRPYPYKPITVRDVAGVPDTTYAHLRTEGMRTLARHLSDTEEQLQDFDS